ncbi:hypothetical protein G7B40_040230 [Aetokthonos hydrillicola Thurmond2011]|jgi:hypothetical protein|uniref:Uncharacterized protein n=1 Tax=Aetokthonos hydrillicola Thurmond2011 TaxID=2712845 RepID=A0AAP5II32_9CYAN|nr:hypothetical protein [Aetokthonos hydrillicola]MBO3459957.1 hypothetical protein [Aetokthonos hydrillicola CCALA 1050]MBW4584076.1 hypothetical protein [Aetokthonos hydrillicola CCALA 1050]MDR9900718.1 hypothetical protein [Aetokthonos hydrillicola Thurmond2011]
MPSPPFSSNSALIETAIAQRALTQLNLAAMYPRVAVRDFEPGAFERGDDVKIRRPKRRTATDLNPRVAPYIFTEAQFFAGSVKLERLWTDGFLSYGYDSNQTMERYLAETSDQIADAIVTPNDSYMYSQFRTWNIAPTGNVSLGDHPPIAISACVDSSGNLTNFNNEGLRGANVFLDKENVPSTNRYAIISSTAKGAFLGDSVVVTGFAATSIGGGQLLQRGLQLGDFTERYGFMVGGSNTVGNQTGVTDLDTVTGTQGTLPIASVAANTAFLYADNATTTYVGAVDFTLTVGTALQNVGVGQIARIGTNTKATAFGVILRVSGNVITLVPYAPNGTKLGYGDITPGTDVFSIPTIPSVSTVNHTEGLAMATRRIAEPRRGSGAVAASITDPVTQLSIQVFTGQYDLGTVSERNAAYMLTGSKITDFRKCGLILSL